MAHMKTQGIQTSIHYPPVHRFSEYQGQGHSIAEGLERTEALSAREVTLPLYPSLSEGDVRLVVEAVRASLNQSMGENA